MAEIFARIKPIKSSTAGEVPGAADLDVAELAINTADGYLFTKHTDNTVVQLGGSASLASIDLIGDVDTTTAAPSTNQALVWSGTAWVPGTVASSIDSLTDVDTSTAAPSVNDTLVWDGTAWVPGTPPATVSSIDDLSDVDTTTAAPTDGQTLTWNNANSKWEPGALSAGAESLGELNDVNVSTYTFSLGTNFDTGEPVPYGRASGATGGSLDTSLGTNAWKMVSGDYYGSGEKLAGFFPGRKRYDLVAVRVRSDQAFTTNNRMSLGGTKQELAFGDGWALYTRDTGFGFYGNGGFTELGTKPTMSADTWYEVTYVIDWGTGPERTLTPTLSLWVDGSIAVNSGVSANDMPTPDHKDFFLAYNSSSQSNSGNKFVDYVRTADVDTLPWGMSDATLTDTGKNLIEGLTRTADIGDFLIYNGIDWVPSGAAANDESLLTQTIGGLSDVSYINGELEIADLDRIKFTSSDVPTDELWMVYANAAYGMSIGAYQTDANGVGISDGACRTHYLTNQHIAHFSGTTGLHWLAQDYTGTENTPELRFSSGNPVTNTGSYIGFKIPTGLTGSQTYTFPAADGTSGQTLTTDGTGSLSWSSISSVITDLVSLDDVENPFVDIGTWTYETATNQYRGVGEIGLQTSPEGIQLAVTNATPGESQESLLLDIVAGDTVVLKVTFGGVDLGEFTVNSGTNFGSSGSEDVTIGINSSALYSAILGSGQNVNGTSMQISAQTALTTGDSLIYDETAAKFQTRALTWGDVTNKPSIVNSVNGNSGALTLGLNELNDVGVGRSDLGAWSYSANTDDYQADSGVGLKTSPNGINLNGLSSTGDRTSLLESIVNGDADAPTDLYISVGGAAHVRCPLSAPHFDYGASGSTYKTFGIGSPDAYDLLNGVAASTSVDIRVYLEPTDAHVLSYNQTLGAWESVASVSGASTLDELNDVDAQNPPETAITYSSYTGNNTPAAGEWHVNTSFFYLPRVDGNGNDQTTNLQALSGETLTITDSTGTQFTMTNVSIVSDELGGGNDRILLDSSEQPSINSSISKVGGITVSSTAFTLSPLPTNDGSLINWSTAESKWKLREAPSIQTSPDFELNDAIGTFTWSTCIGGSTIGPSDVAGEWGGNEVGGNTVISVHATDDAVDRTTFLQAVSTGDVINVNGTDRTVTSKADFISLQNEMRITFSGDGYIDNTAGSNQLTMSSPDWSTGKDPLGAGQALVWDATTNKFMPTPIITLADLKAEVAASTDFADFQSRIAAL